MKKNITKIISAFLVLLLCGSFFTSCVRQNNKLPDIDADGDEINFRGAKLRIYAHDWIIHTFSTSMSYDINATLERRKNHLKKLENDFNLVIDPHEATPAMVIGDMMNGSRTADLIYMYPDYLYDIYSAGALMPYEDIPDIDYFGGNFGPEKLLKQTLFGDKHYGIFPYLWETAPGLVGLVLINDGLISEINGMQNPREIIEAGDWTWEAFRRACKQGTYSDDEGDHYGFGIADHGDCPAHDMLSFVCIFSNGGNPVVCENGRYRSGLSDTNVTEALEYAASLYKDGVILYGISGLSYMAWSTGQHPLYLAKSFEIEKNDDTIKDYGMIPFPQGPSANENSVGSYYYNTDHFAAVCVGTVYSEDELAVIINRLFDTFENTPYPEGWKTYELENNYMHEEDFHAYVHALENAEYYNTRIFRNISEQITQAFASVITKGVSPQIAVNSFSDAFQSSIDKYYDQ